MFSMMEYIMRTLHRSITEVWRSFILLASQPLLLFNIARIIGWGPLVDDSLGAAVQFTCNQSNSSRSRHITTYTYSVPELSLSARLR